MGKLNVVHQKGLKQQKAKKKPVKIVQISNPMKVTATTSEFKGIVQELTGQDSDMSLLRKYAAAEESEAPPPAAGDSAPAADDYIEDRCSTDYWNVDNKFDLFDEILTSQMLVDLANFIPFGSYDNSSPSWDYAESLDGARWD